LVDHYFTLPGRSRFTSGISTERRLLLDSISVAIWHSRDVETYGMVNKAYDEYFNMDAKEIAHKRRDTIPGKETLALALPATARYLLRKTCIIISYGSYG
jgi:hypothetical protein